VNSPSYCFRRTRQNRKHGNRIFSPKSCKHNALKLSTVAANRTTTRGNTASSRLLTHAQCSTSLSGVSRCVKNGSCSWSSTEWKTIDSITATSCCYKTAEQRSSARTRREIQSNCCSAKFNFTSSKLWPPTGQSRTQLFPRFRESWGSTGISCESTMLEKSTQVGKDSSSSVSCSCFCQVVQKHYLAKMGPAFDCLIRK